MVIADVPQPSEALIALFSLFSVCLCPLLALQVERHRARRVEEDDLAHIERGELASATEWEDGLRWAAGRGDVSQAVREAVPGLPPGPDAKQPWVLASSLLAGAGCAWKTWNAASQAAELDWQLAATMLCSSLGCALLVVTSLMDARHHEIAHAPLESSFLLLILAQAFAHRGMGPALSGVVVRALGTGATLLARRFAPGAIGTGDVWLLGCHAGLLAVSDQPQAALLALVGSCACVAALSPDPDTPARVPCACVVLPSLLAA